MANNYQVNKFYTEIAKKHAMLLEHQFIVEFVSGTGDNTYSGFGQEIENNIAYYAQSAKIPKYSISSAKMSFFATEFRQPGVKTFDHSWDCEILIDRDLTIYKKLKEWREQISSLENSGGGAKTIPDMNLRVTVLDSKDMSTVKTSFVLAGVWPAKTPTLPLGYESGESAPMKVGISFKYQYAYEERDGEGTESDPLQFNK
jgi:hypothetical protein